MPLPLPQEEKEQMVKALQVGCIAKGEKRLVLLDNPKSARDGQAWRGV